MFCRRLHHSSVDSGGFAEDASHEWHLSAPRCFGSASRHWHGSIDTAPASLKRDLALGRWAARSHCVRDAADVRFYGDTHGIEFVSNPLGIHSQNARLFAG
ncbi:hypothetical protein K227x_53460 [Rubripirellula lacrimiformis]|uniref:Uncharacterized protein n=1 Tax=Rubripirellula lacrimiformis TaxID=1930273 RepID=A0A517NIG4_9BACT|nr:hypothetical protein K227x_53460 [Rubripirellula lacrimiformis]